MPSSKYEWYTWVQLDQTLNNHRDHGYNNQNKKLWISEHASKYAQDNCMSNIHNHDATEAIKHKYQIDIIVVNLTYHKKKSTWPPHGHTVQNPKT